MIKLTSLVLIKLIVLAAASLKEIWLHTLHHLSVLRCGLALIDKLVIVIAGKIVMASEVIA